jgi:hypothetical protein
MEVKQKISPNIKSKYTLFQPYVLLSYYQSKRNYISKVLKIFQRKHSKSKDGFDIISSTVWILTKLYESWKGLIQDFSGTGQVQNLSIKWECVYLFRYWVLCSAPVLFSCPCTKIINLTSST